MDTVNTFDNQFGPEWTRLGFCENLLRLLCEQRLRTNGTWTGSQTSGLSSPESNSADSMVESQAFATREDVMETLRSNISYNQYSKCASQNFQPQSFSRARHV